MKGLKRLKYLGKQKTALGDVEVKFINNKYHIYAGTPEILLFSGNEEQIEDFIYAANTLPGLVNRKHPKILIKYIVMCIIIIVIVFLYSI